MANNLGWLLRPTHELIKQNTTARKTTREGGKFTQNPHNTSDGGEQTSSKYDSDTIAPNVQASGDLSGTKHVELGENSSNHKEVICGNPSVDHSTTDLDEGSDATVEGGRSSDSLPHLSDKDTHVDDKKCDGETSSTGTCTIRKRTLDSHETDDVESDIRQDVKRVKM